MADGSRLETFDPDGWQLNSVDGQPSVPQPLYESSREIQNIESIEPNKDSDTEETDMELIYPTPPPAGIHPALRNPNSFVMNLHTASQNNSNTD